MKVLNLLAISIFLLSVLISFDTGYCMVGYLEPMIGHHRIVPDSNTLLKRVLRRSFGEKMRKIYSFVDEKFGSTDKTNPISIVGAVKNSYDYVISVCGDVESSEITFIIVVSLKKICLDPNIRGPISVTSRYECTPLHVVLFCLWNLSLDREIEESLKSAGVDLEMIKNLEIKSAQQCRGFFKIFELVGAGFCRQDSLGVSVLDFIGQNCKFGEI